MSGIQIRVPLCLLVVPRRGVVLQHWETPSLPDPQIRVAQARASLRTRAMYPVRSVTLMAPLASRRLKVCEHLRQ